MVTQHKFVDALLVFVCLQAGVHNFTWHPRFTTMVFKFACNVTVRRKRNGRNVVYSPQWTESRPHHPRQRPIKSGLKTRPGLETSITDTRHCLWIYFCAAMSTFKRESGVYYQSGLYYPFLNTCMVIVLMLYSI